MDSTGTPYKCTAWGLFILLRSFLGIAAIMLSCNQLIFWACASMIACIWFDVVICFVAKRKKYERSAFDIQIEALVDFLCFVIAPAIATYSMYPQHYTMTSASVFIICGMYRLARFQCQGLVSGGYTGLPVTYCGYLIPGLLLAAFYTHTDHWIPTVGLLVVSLLMVSKRIHIPEL